MCSIARCFTNYVWPVFDLSLRVVGLAPTDSTYGRKDLPYNEWEETIRRTRPDILMTEYNLPSRDGGHFYAQSWRHRTQKPKGVVIYVHGLSEYSARFARVAQQVVDAGFIVYGIDHIGYGRSDGLHGYIPSIRLLCDNLNRLIVHIRDATLEGSLPRFLWGISLGGHITLQYSLLYPETIKGMVLLCPAIYPAGDSTPHIVVQQIAKVLRLVCPSLPVVEGNRGKNCTLQEHEDAFLADPRNYRGRLRIGTGLAMLDSFLDLRANLHKVKVPFIIHHGTVDRAVDIKGTVELVEKSPCRDREVHYYEDNQHDLFVEKAAPEVMEKSLSWLKKHV
eukprot:Colp12_sorted_trinity150504_noHs@7012